MDLDDQVKFGHLLLHERKCRTCGERKNLIEGFYRTRKDRERFHHHSLMNVKTVQRRESRSHQILGSIQIGSSRRNSPRKCPFPKYFQIN